MVLEPLVSELVEGEMVLLEEMVTMQLDMEEVVEEQMIMDTVHM